MVPRQQGEDVSAKLIPGSFLVVGRRGCHCFFNNACREVHRVSAQ
jgi:hypothetical protein